MLKCKLNTSVKYKGKFYIPGDEIEIAEKDEQLFKKYGVVLKETVKVVEVVKEVKVEVKPKKSAAKKTTTKKKQVKE